MRHAAADDTYGLLSGDARYHHAAAMPQAIARCSAPRFSDCCAEGTIQQHFSLSPSQAISFSRRYLCRQRDYMRKYFDGRYERCVYMMSFNASSRRRHYFPLQPCSFTYRYYALKRLLGQYSSRPRTPSGKARRAFMPLAADDRPDILRQVMGHFF